MHPANIDGSARKEFSASMAVEASSNETADVALSATVRAKTVALSSSWRRALLKSYASKAALARNSAAPLMIIVIATIFLDMERLRKEIIASRSAGAAVRCPRAAAILNSLAARRAAQHLD